MDTNNLYIVLANAYMDKYPGKLEEVIADLKEALSWAISIDPEIFEREC